MANNLHITDSANGICPGCGAGDCTPATCPAYVEWHRHGSDDREHGYKVAGGTYDCPECEAEGETS